MFDFIPFFGGGRRGDNIWWHHTSGCCSFCQSVGCEQQPTVIGARAEVHRINPIQSKGEGRGIQRVLSS